ncbi:hypothetical protein F5Y19DRAFT_475379 [Xylariaceae sp. FL1651]|nr:hypothetical protein F5Y19DRAFT_475379 [Xylariaceae sp. FL1651]
MAPLAASPASGSDNKEDRFPLICNKGHVHPHPLGGVALLLCRKRKNADKYELLVRYKYDLSKPEPPRWLIVPNAVRNCGESAEECALRAAGVELGLTRNAFNLRGDWWSGKVGYTEIATVLATPRIKMGDRVGHHDTFDFHWVPVEEVEQVEIFPGIYINNTGLMDQVLSLAEDEKKSVLPTVKRALSLSRFLSEGKRISK